MKVLTGDGTSAIVVHKKVHAGEFAKACKPTSRSAGDEPAQLIDCRGRARRADLRVQVKHSTKSFAPTCERIARFNPFRTRALGIVGLSVG